MVPAAAPTFSTTMVWPRISPSTSACSRALASMPPPGANGTISVMGAGRPFLRGGGRGEARPMRRATRTQIFDSVASPLSSYSISTPLALDRRAPALDLALDELAEIFGRTPVRRDGMTPKVLNRVEQDRRVERVAGRLGELSARSAAACPWGTRTRPRRRSRGLSVPSSSAVGSVSRPGAGSGPSAASALTVPDWICGTAVEICSSM